MTNHIHIHVGKTKDSASSATKGKVFTALGYVQDATKAIRTIEDEDKADEKKKRSQERGTPVGEESGFHGEGMKG